jgi:hypothetical protein
MENSWATKAAIEMIIFMGITYTAVLLVMGSTGGVTWPTAAPDSPAATIPVLNIIMGLINFIAGVVGVLFSLFTFNIPGMPAEVRMILTPLYTGMAIFCIIVFWDKILLVVETVINVPILLYNTFVLPFRPVGSAMNYFHFSRD